MKKSNLILHNFSNWVLAGLLSLLGYSCSEQTEEYGSPHANFEVKGKVQNKAGEAISNIQIQIVASINNSGAILDNPNDTLPEIYKTDSQGKFSSTFEYFPVNNLKILATDIDSTENGSYLNKTTEIDIASSDFSNGKGWFEGNVKKEITIILDEKKDN